MNEAAITIKELIKKGIKQCQTAKLQNLKREKVNYWSKVEIKIGNKIEKDKCLIYI